MIENIRLSFQGIWSHKMRSFLTMLGIIIGIASIIAIVSTIKGTSEQIKEDLIGSGNNTVTITLYDGDNPYDTEFGMSGGTPPVISQEQKDKVLELDHVENATFYYSRSYTSSVYYQNTAFQGGSVYGVDMNYLDTCGYSVQLGRGFLQEDYDGYNKVALVDSNAAENLFSGENPVGKTIEIGSEPFIVVGVVHQNEDFLPNIEDISQFYEYFQTMMGCIMIPSASWPIVFSYDEPENAIIKADSTDNMSSAGNAAADVLKEGIVNTSSTNYEYRADDVMERVRNLQRLSESTNQQLIWIASISLLVGGIGVMNIMLVSVTERTSEIGLKKAIGARKKTIMAQFLTEASVLTSIGGVIGVISGIGLSRVVARVSGSPTAISIPAIIGSVVFSMMIGLIFGLLPSYKAANLNPIDALRSE
ncbi:MAG TPA: ABC transporter permease [Candidatus Blautia faecavium]|uniref:ABC transporter permease n=1 Tax=Candidatus Blautia faecavium TaxID=2838487 RepID=A0A9D2RW11_9FIRM|nr:ABC transporter permease [Candidatus Blautia faecavium]